MLMAANIRQSSIGHKIKSGATGSANRNIPDYGTLTEDDDRIGVEWLPSSTSSRNIDDFVS